MNRDGAPTLMMYEAPRVTEALPSEDCTVVTLSSLEEVCESKGITLVVHPAVRRAIKGYEESFYVGLRCFLAGETDGLYFLPLRTGGYVRLVLSKRSSPGGYNILRVDPLTTEGLARIRASLHDPEREA